MSHQEDDYMVRSGNFAFDPLNITPDELEFVRGLQAQRAESKAAQAASLLHRLDQDTRELTPYLGDDVELMKEALQLLINQAKSS